MRITFQLLLTNSQVSRLRKAFGPLLKRVLPLIGNIYKPLAKSILVPLRLTAPASAIEMLLLIRKRLDQV